MAHPAVVKRVIWFSRDDLLTLTKIPVKNIAMKKILSLFVLTILVLASCSKYDDTELRNKVNGYESRIAALESLSTYQTLLQKLQAGKTVTAYSQSGNDITLTFSDGSSVTFNQQGVPGESIAGPAGPTPTFQIKDDRWQVSYDGGKTWSDVGPAVEKSLFQNVTADGNTLTITLADGTTIPVYYGEKEAYGLAVGNGRKWYSFAESQEAYMAGELKIPYTLSGPIENINDVVIVPNITSFAYDYTIMRGAVTVDPIDAKSGNIILKRTHNQEVTYDWGQWWIDYPGYRVDLMAFFPDGSSKAVQFSVCSSEVLLQGTDGCDFETDDITETMLPYEMPKNGGNFSFEVYHDIWNQGEYDGDPLPMYKFTDLYYVNSTNGFASNAMTTGYTYSDPEFVGGDSYFTLRYKITVKFQANTTGKERKCWIGVVRKTNPNSGIYLFYIPVIQPGN